MADFLRKHWFYATIQFASIVVWLWWIPYGHLPWAGVSIAIVAVQAAVMSVHDDMQKWQKFLWLLLIGAFLVTEFRAIRKDRNDAYQQALKDRAEQDEKFLKLNNKQDSEFLATTTGFNGLQDFEKQLHGKIVPVQQFGKGGIPEKNQNTPPIVATAPPPVQEPAPAPVAPSLSGDLILSQSDDKSTRLDAPYKVKVVIQTTVEMQTLKLAMKCNAPIVEAMGGPSGSGMLISTGQGISPQDHSIWLFQYGSAIPPFGPANPIVVNVWAASPILCNQARTF